MRIRSRTTRRFDTFDRKFDAMIVAILHRDGFTETQPYVFTRPDLNGRDLIYFDVEGKSFIVLIGFKPNYMEEIDDLFTHLLLTNQPHTGGCVYLTPKCVTCYPKEYACKLAAKRDRSFNMVVEALTTHVPGWLASLRIPVCYADAVPPTCLMYVGRANEVAGRLDLARAAYEEQMRRALVCWEMATFPQFVASEGAREFVYLCLKLQRELDKCQKVMDAIGFNPQVQPLLGIHKQ